MKGDKWSAAFKARKNSTQSNPIEIFDIYLGNQEEVDENTLFFNDSNYNFSFYPYKDENNKQNYIALGLNRGSVSNSSSNAIDGLRIKLDNVSRTFSTLFTQYDLRGKRIVIRQVYGDLLNNYDDSDLLFDGILDSPTISLEDGLEIEVRHSITDTLDCLIPREKYYIQCNNMFCGTECANGILSSTLKDKKTAQTIDTVISQVLFTDATRTGDVANYYAPGIVEMTGGTANNIGEKRRITEATGDNVRLDYTFPSLIVSGDEYSIERDCDKTHGQCVDKFNNDANFRGFKYLPTNLVVR